MQNRFPNNVSHSKQDYKQIKDEAPDALLQTITDLVSIMKSLSNQAVLGIRYNSFVLDVACLARTLHRIREVQPTGLPSDTLAQASTTMEKLIKCTDECKAFFTGTVVDHGTIQQLEQTLHSFWSVVMETASILTRCLSLLPRLEPPHPSMMNYPGDVMVSRKRGADKYDIRAGCELETQTPESRGQWHSKTTIFEFINITCGGERVYDPFFIARTKPQAKQFFTAGRVFTILWDTRNEDDRIHEVAERENRVVSNRSYMTGFEGIYTGPFQGPEIIRHFLVFEQGVSSSLCFPVSTFQNTGCAMQPDQHNYTVIFTGLDTPMLLADEDTMIHPMLRVAKVPVWRPSPGIKGQRTELPPYNALPTNELPEKARVDLRRVCEVDFNVQCCNIGLLDEGSLGWLRTYVS